MAYDALGNYVPDDAVSVDDMRQQLIAKNQTPQFIRNLEALYQLLPGSVASRSTAQGVKPIAETVATVGSGLAAPFLGVAKGIGQNILNNTNERVDRPELAEAFTYQPKTQTGQNYVESIMGALDASKLPPYIAHAGQFRFTPDDLRVAGKTAVSDVRNFPMDFANARAGFQREYPTLGSTAAGAVQRAEPLLEKGLSMYERGQLTPGFNPVSEAVKPLYGEWPTTLASKDLPLHMQGEVGSILQNAILTPSKVYDTWVDRLGYDLRRDWLEFLTKETGEHYGIVPDDVNKIRELADIFASSKNYSLPTENEIKPYSEMQTIADSYNNWILGPHKKYITTQLGTGVETDPLLKAVEESNFNPFIDTRNIEQQRSDVEKRGNRNREWALEQVKLINQDADFAKRLAKISPDNPKYQKEHFLFDLDKTKNVGLQTATTPAGKDLENRIDNAILSVSHNFNPLHADEKTLQQFPFTEKLKVKTPVYDVLPYQLKREVGIEKIQQDVLKRLMSGDIKPENLKNTSIESVVRNIISDKQNAIKEAAKNKELYLDWRKKNHDSLPADVAFTDAEGNPTGEKMVVFDADMAETNPDLVIRNLSQDTKELNHCVGSCGHGTAEYSNRHVPMVEPHTGTTPKGSDSTYGPNYIKKIKNGDIQIASLRGPNGESKATLELRPERTAPGIYEQHMAIKDWLERNASSYVEKYAENRANMGVTSAKETAIDNFPELREVLKQLDESAKTSSKFKVEQIKGEGNKELKPDAIEAVKNWLNSKGDLVKLNHIEDLRNMPGIIDLRNTKPHEIADIYQSIHPDKLDSFLGDLVDKKLEGNELTKERYLAGYIDPFEIIQDEVPRFVNIDDLRKAAEKHGYDIERRPEDKMTTGTKTNGLNDMDRLILESEVNTFFDRGRLPDDFADYLPDYQEDVLALLGFTDNYSYRLPQHMHMELTRKLLNQEEYRTWIESTLRAAETNQLNGFTLYQMENIASIIENWLRLHPFE